MAKFPTYVQLTADKLFKRLLRKELLEQGHDLSGRLSDSIDIKSERVGDAIFISVFADYYAKYINEGIKPQDISWKMLPTVISYFAKRGLGEHQAKSAAILTIKKWMVEGMPTKESTRFSKNDRRTNFVGYAFDKGDSTINSELSNAFDYELNIYFGKIDKA